MIDYISSLLEREHSQKEMRFPEFSDAIYRFGEHWDWEPHEVLTKDLYKLNMFRLTADESGNSLERTRGPILLQHGSGQSGIAWFNERTDAKISVFPILLARAGFDVWIGNTRGSRNSREHVLVDDTDPWYWDFSWSELGLYDLPSMIDHIYTETDMQKVTYIGHS